MEISTTEQVILYSTDNSTAWNISDVDSEFRYHLFSVAYGIIFALGFIANLYVLFVLRCLREAKSMNEIRIYMTNLTIADLLFVCALPLWIDYYSRKGHWIFGDFLCQLTGSLFFINTYCSILFLGAISVSRYWAITRPLDAASSDHRRRGKIVCAMIWAVTISMAITFLVSPQTNEKNKRSIRCFEGYENTEPSKKSVVLAIHLAIIAMFFIVFFLVVVCNVLIARALFSQSVPQPRIRSAASELRETNKVKSFSSNRRPTGIKRRALQMLMAVVGVFALCFLPHHVVQGFWTLAVLDIQDGWGHVAWDRKTVQALNDAHQVTLLLMGLNCILDPVVYCFATRKFRAFIVAHMKKLIMGDGCSQTSITQLSKDSKHHSQRLQSQNRLAEEDAPQ